MHSKPFASKRLLLRRVVDPRRGDANSLLVLAAPEAINGAMIIEIEAGMYENGRRVSRKKQLLRSDTLIGAQGAIRRRKFLDGLGV